MKGWVLRRGWIWIYFGGRVAGFADGLDIKVRKRKDSKVTLRFRAGATG